jgi:glycine/D-amino acid oxidase-like deaminating enzyme
VAGALLSFDEAQIQPEWLLAALEEAALRRGAEIRQGEVTGISGTGTPGVRLAGGELLEGDRVVLAAGAWSGELGGSWLPVRPVKGQLLVFQEGPGPSPIIYAGHNYLLTKVDGSVLLGGTVEEAGFSLQADAGGEALRDLLPGLWPALHRAPAETRVGLRPASPDGLPICGGLPGMPGVYAFTAHFRNGFLLCPHGARLGAREILDGEAQALFSALRPQRFGELALS